MPLSIKAALIALVITGALYDLLWRRVPNWLVLSGLLMGAALNAFLFSWPGLRHAGLGLTLALAVYLPLYLLRAIGAGDLKLMMAVGSLVGYRAWLAIFVLTGITGGAIAVLVLVLHGRVEKTLRNVGFLLHRLLRLQRPYQANPELDVRSGKGMRLPHAASIALGAGVYLAAAYFSRM